MTGQHHCLVEIYLLQTAQSVAQWLPLPPLPEVGSGLPEPQQLLHQPLPPRHQAQAGGAGPSAGGVEGTPSVQTANQGEKELDLRMMTG